MPQPANRLIFSIALGLLVTTSATAQFGGMELERGAARAQARARQTFTMPENQFNVWAFGNGRNALSARSQLEALLTDRISDITRICQLTPAQKQKLELAGQGDIKHYLDTVAETRRKYVNIQIEQERLNDVIAEVQSLQAPLNQSQFLLLTEKTLLDKTLGTVLKPAQLAKYEDHVNQSHRFHWHARAKLVVAMLDEGLGLSADQREQLTELLAAETKPPPPRPVAEYYFMLFQAARIPEDRFKAFLDPAQWQFLKQQLDHSLQFEEQFRRNGLLPGGGAPPRPLAPVGIRF